MAVHTAFLMIGFNSFICLSDRCWTWKSSMAWRITIAIYMDITCTDFDTLLLWRVLPVLVFLLARLRTRFWSNLNEIISQLGCLPPLQFIFSSSHKDYLTHQQSVFSFRSGLWVSSTCARAVYVHRYAGLYSRKISGYLSGCFNASNSMSISRSGQ